MAGCWASELNFASVPGGDDVPAHQLAKYSTCITDCALHPARVLFPFGGVLCQIGPPACHKSEGCLLVLLAICSLFLSPYDPWKESVDAACRLHVGRQG